MKKKMSAFLVSIVSFLLILTCMNLGTTFAKVDEGLYIKNHGTSDVIDIPSNFDTGQVWIDKSVVDHEDGSFTITLRAAAKGYQANETDPTLSSPLSMDSSIVLTDVIGDGFAIKQTLPEGVTNVNDTVTWTIPADQLQTDGTMMSISFDVEYDATSAGTYYTNASASAVFTPSEANPYYYDITSVNQEVSAEEQAVKTVTTTPKVNFMWNEASVTTQLLAKGYVELAVKETELPDVSNDETLQEFTDVGYDYTTYTAAGPLISKKTNQVRTALNETATNGVVQNKTATYLEDGTIAIDLEAYVTGKVSTVSKPVDVVMVLDQSGSMSESIMSYVPVYSLNTSMPSYFVKIDNQYIALHYGANASKPIGPKVWYYGDYNNQHIIYEKTSSDDTDPTHTQVYTSSYSHSGKLEALQDSVKQFLNKITEDGVTNNVNHRVAMVGFSDQDKTGILSLSDTAYYDNLTENDTSLYQAALQDVTANIITTDTNFTTGVNKVLRKAWSSINANGATRTDLGMELANRILKSDTDKSRDKIVIVFTDGCPTPLNDFDTNVANAALAQSKDIKNNNATVYSIGILGGTDPNQALQDDPTDTDVTNHPNKMNKFMHVMSSNYRDGELSLSRPVSKDTNNPQNNGYYLSASNADDLKEIFNNIYEQITPSIALDATATLSDTMSKYFEVTKDTKVTVEKHNYVGTVDGKRTWKYEKDITSEVTISSEGNKITVTGFDYAGNTVADSSLTGTATGSKIVVKLSNIKTIDGFIGGDAVPTNIVDSGILDGNGNFVAKFDVPTVSVPLKLDGVSNNSSIYLGNSWDNVEEFLTNEQGELVYSKDGKTYVYDGVKNYFATVTYVIKHGNEVVGTYKINRGTTTLNKDTFNFDTSTMDSSQAFTITPTVTSEKEKQTLKGKTLNAMLYVFKPTIEVTDQVLFYGEETTMSTLVKDEIKWQCTDSNNAQLPKALEPKLTLSVTNVANDESINDFNEKLELTEDTQYQMTIKNATQDITKASTIKNTSQGSDQDEMHDLTVYVVKGQLSITKKIDQQYTEDKELNANQSFVFKIERKDTEDGNVVETFYQTLNFSANKDTMSKTMNVTGLKKGYYTVTEVEAWSWKYQLSSSSSNASSQTTSNMYIGEKTNDTYFGAMESKSANIKEQPAVTTFKNSFNSNFTSIFGDVASAINQFVSK